MEKACVAFSPGHISGYFKPVHGKSTDETGSTGAGIVISEGVTALVKTAHDTSVEITMADSRGLVIERIPGSPPIESLLKMLGVTAGVITRCSLPISAGFGLSAAALTATSLAANRVFSLGLSTKECTGFAHKAEIIHKTGLGDIAACQGGGIDCRTGPGINAGITRLTGHFPCIYAVNFGPLPSPGILGSPTAMEQVTRAYPGTCPGSIEELLLLSRDFSEKSGLITPDVRKALDLCDKAGVQASMTMLGNGIFATGEGAYEVLSCYPRVFTLHVATTGPHLLPSGSW